MQLCTFHQDLKFYCFFCDVILRHEKVSRIDLENNVRSHVDNDYMALKTDEQHVNKQNRREQTVYCFQELRRTSFQSENNPPNICPTNSLRTNQITVLKSSYQKLL